MQRSDKDRNVNRTETNNKNVSESMQKQILKCMYVKYQGRDVSVSRDLSKNEVKMFVAEESVTSVKGNCVNFTQLLQHYECTPWVTYFQQS